MAIAAFRVRDAKRGEPRDKLSFILDANHARTRIRRAVIQGQEDGRLDRTEELPEQSCRGKYGEIIPCTGDKEYA